MEGNEGNSSFDFLRLLLSVMLIASLLTPDNRSNSRGNLRDSVTERNMRIVEQQLKKKLDLDVQYMYSPDSNYAYNVSGIFDGKWKSTNESIVTRTSQVSLGVVNNMIRRNQNTSVNGVEGSLSIHLYDKGVYRKNMHYIQGVMTLIEGEQDSSDDSLTLTFTGLYFLPTGHLSLFSNTYGTSYLIRWLSTPSTSEMRIPNNYSAIVGFSANNTNLLYLDRHRSYLDKETTRCLYQMDLDLLSLPPSTDPEITHNPHSRILLNATGSLVSRNCATNLRVDLGGFSMDTDHILTKSRVYSLAAVLVSFAECFVYIKVMQSILFSSTQAASLLTFCLFSAIDVLLAMVHSMLGVFFLGLFSSFYFVSFHKFFVFSVVEMRLMFIVWKSYYPDINATNYQQYQRKLSCLFLCLCLFIIVSLVSVYSQNRLSYYLIFFVYSFWTPQIVRSLQLGQRPPFTARQIIVLSALKLFFPLYIFFCPYNMLRMFTAVEIPMNFGIKLVMWVLVQVGVGALVDNRLCCCSCRRCTTRTRYCRPSCDPRSTTITPSPPL